MKLLRARMAFVLMLTISLTQSIDTARIHSVLLKKADLEYPVRILLKESNVPVEWTLTNRGGFTLYCPQDNKTSLIRDSELSITCEESTVICNGIRSKELHILPNSGRLTFESIPYDGFFSVHASQGAALLINHLDLEDYLAAVLPYESIPSWPDEVQKALCIACRTYAVSKLESHKAGKKTHLYDLKNTVLDQVYKGHAKKTSLCRIVEQTKGIILTSDDQPHKPIVAMYSAVCGSIIPAQKKTGIYHEAPYLKRTYACTYCKDQPLYTWSSSYTLKELEKPLKKIYPDLGQLTSVSMSSYDKAGVAHTVILQGSQRKVTMNAHDFRMLFPKIRSLCCSCSTKNGVLHATGKGHGHHLGLCQWGAYRMAQEGFSFDEILAFYYPGTHLTKISSK